MSQNTSSIPGALLRHPRVLRAAREAFDRHWDRLMRLDRGFMSHDITPAELAEGTLASHARFEADRIRIAQEARA